ncbi:cytochrome p450, partial [Plakobranchus ocellatus]
MLATIVLGVVLLYILYKYFYPSNEKRKMLDKIPGPKPLPLIGNAHQLRIGHDWYLQTLGLAKEHPDIFVLWLAFKPQLVIHKAEYAEVILNGMKHIDKSPDYNFLHPWLGTGLLTSTGDKWKSRRRMLTPTFHFNILHDFLHVFNKKSHILVEKLKGKAEKGGQFNLFQDIALCALDIISETAMGKDINAQSADSEYVHAVYRMSNLTDTRMRQPWMWPDILFNLFGPGHEHDEKLKILHDFTNSVISDRLKDFDSIKSEMIRQGMSGEAGMGLRDKKVRLAFLDMLIFMSDNLTKLSFEDIREEVDTFMFEGHDTTAAAMNWATHLIGANPECQAKVHEEIDSVFGQDDRDPTMEDLKELKYLECCIKEALRLFPSVPMFARTASEDVHL